MSCQATQQGRRRRTVGIVGGMGPWATHAFYGELLRATRARRDQDYLHVVIDSNATIPDRTSYLLGAGVDPRPAIVDSAQRLVTVGCELLVIPCNTASAFTDYVQRMVDVPVIDWIGTAVHEVTRTRPSRVGILATSGTIATRLYQQQLEAYGVAWAVPAAEGQEAVMEAIYGTHGVKAGVVDSLTRRLILVAARDLVRRGADAILLGCTELPIALAAGDRRWPAPVFDPSRAVANQVVVEAGAEVRIPDDVRSND